MAGLNYEEKVYDVQVFETDGDADPVVYKDITGISRDEFNVLTITGPPSEIIQDSAGNDVAPVMGEFNATAWAYYEITSASRTKVD